MVSQAPACKNNLKKTLEQDPLLPSLLSLFGATNAANLSLPPIHQRDQLGPAASSSRGRPFFLLDVEYQGFDPRLSGSQLLDPRLPPIHQCDQPAGSSSWARGRPLFPQAPNMSFNMKADSELKQLPDFNVFKFGVARGNQLPHARETESVPEGWRLTEVSSSVSYIHPCLLE